jgi:hypothetical protein
MVQTVCATSYGPIWRSTAYAAVAVTNSQGQGQTRSRNAMKAKRPMPYDVWAYRPTRVLAKSILAGPTLRGETSSLSDGCLHGSV